PARADRWTPGPGRSARYGPRRAARPARAPPRARAVASARSRRRPARDEPRTGFRSSRRRRRRPAGSRVLGLQVPHVRARVEPRAGRLLERLLRRELAPVHVEMVAEPLPQRGELAPFELL